MVVVASYTANLAAFLAMEAREIRIGSMADLVAGGKAHVNGFPSSLISNTAFV